MPNPYVDLNTLRILNDGSGQTLSASGLDMNSPVTNDDDPLLLHLASAQSDAPNPPASLNADDMQVGNHVQFDSSHKPAKDQMIRVQGGRFVSAATEGKALAIAKLHPAGPVPPPAKPDANGQIKIAPLNGKYYPDIVAFGKQYGFVPSFPDPADAAIMGGHHAKNKQTKEGPHSRGQAVDFAVKYKPGGKQLDDASMNYFIQQALAAGYSVEDSRDDDKLAGGRHIHIQSTNFPTNKRWNASLAPQGKRTKYRAGMWKPEGALMRALPDPRQAR